MLRLLPSALCSNATERQLFLRDIIVFVFAAHVLFFVAMIGSSIFGKKHDVYAISMHQTGATYVLMPLHKRVDRQPQKSKRKGSNKLGSSKVVNYDEYKNRKNKNKSKASSAAKLASTVTRKSAQSVNSKSKPSVVLASGKTVLALKAVSLNKGKNKSKTNTIKIDPVVDITQAVVPEIKNEVAVKVLDQVKLQVSEKSEQKQLDQEKKTAEEDLLSAQTGPRLQNSEAGKESGDDFDEENIIFVGYEQLDGCMVGAKIQQEILDRWTPPVGIAPGTSCLMRVKISAEGVASKVEIEKSSGVLVYDMSSRAALLQVEYPKAVYGKTITLALTN